MPQNITLTADTTSDKRYEAVVINEPFVKLGFDNDGWIFVSISLIAAATLTGGYIVVRRLHNRF